MSFCCKLVKGSHEPVYGHREEGRNIFQLRLNRHVFLCVRSQDQQLHPEHRIGIRILQVPHILLVVEKNSYHCIHFLMMMELRIVVMELIVGSYFRNLDLLGDRMMIVRMTVVEKELHIVSLVVVQVHHIGSLVVVQVHRIESLAEVEHNLFFQSLMKEVRSLFLVEMRNYLHLVLHIDSKEIQIGSIQSCFLLEVVNMNFSEALHVKQQGALISEEQQTIEEFNHMHI